MRPSALGWAIALPTGEVRLDTVHETRRAAMVNGLVTLAGLMVTNDMSDGTIQAAYEQLLEANGYAVSQVKVERVPG